MADYVALTNCRRMLDRSGNCRRSSKTSLRSLPVAPGTPQPRAESKTPAQQS